jgi:organic radical activating enzyme
MKITDVFYSLQGEGPAVGRPAIFVRLAGCNLDCKDCDEKKKYGKRFEETTPASVISRVKNYLKTYPNSRIIFTGGEPLLQPEAIAEIMDGLPGQTFDIETNGTENTQLDLFNKFNIITVSPKKNCFATLKESAEFFKKWGNISDNGRHNVFFKIVVGSLPWAWSESEVRIVLETSNVSATRVWLMPAGDDNNKLLISARNCWKVAMRLGCNYSDRLHIRTGGK